MHIYISVYIPLAACAHARTDCTTRIHACTHTHLYIYVRQLLLDYSRCSPGALVLQPEDELVGSTPSAGRERYQARDFVSRHRLGLQLAVNFFETWHERRGGPLGGSSFAARPGWPVPDEESLARGGHLIPHVERPAATATAGAKEKEEL